jgi:hypothetical protein
MKALVTIASICVVLLSMHGEVGLGQETPLVAGLAKSRVEIGARDFLVSSSNWPTVVSGTLPDEAHLAIKGLELITLDGTPMVPIVAPHRRLLIFHRYDINVRDKAAPGGFDAKYLLVNGLHFATAMADIAITQHCIANHTCREGNPLVPSAPAAAYGVEFGLASLGAVTSHYAKFNGSHLWLVTPLIGVGTHIIGIASGLQHF